MLEKHVVRERYGVESFKVPEKMQIAIQRDGLPLAMMRNGGQFRQLFQDHGSEL
jgi:hypothetical protein